MSSEYSLHSGVSAHVIDDLIREHRDISPAVYVNNKPLVLQVRGECRNCYYSVSFGEADYCYNKEKINNLLNEIDKTKGLNEILNQNKVLLNGKFKESTKQDCYDRRFKSIY